MVKDSFLIIFLFCSFTAVAQHPVPFKMNNDMDRYSDFEKNQVKSLYKFYTLKINPSYEIINGKAYIPYYSQSEFKPLLFSGKNHSSSITTNGRKFEGVFLNYDTFTDEVIFNDSARSFVTKPHMVALNRANIDGFELYFDNDTLSFIYLGGNNGSDPDLKNGFYEVAYKNGSEYLIRHRSSAYIENNVVEYDYSPVGYVRVDSAYFRIKTSRQFIRLFGERSGEVRKFIKESGINIRKADKKQIVSVLKFYDNRNSNNQKTNNK